eukprot:RCo035371
MVETVQQRIAGTVQVDLFDKAENVDEWLTPVLESEPVVGLSFFWDADEVEDDVVITNNRVSVFVVGLRERCLVFQPRGVDQLPSKLVELFGHTALIKATCGFSPVYLRKLTERGLTLCQYMDLGDIERKFNKEAPKKDIATLAEETFGLPSAPSEALSQWSAETLSQAQIEWAVSLAVVCVHVYHSNQDKVQKMIRRLALACPEKGCQRYFSTEKSLDHHLQVAHNHPAPLDPNTHQCPRCIKHFRSATALVQHIEVAHPDHSLPRPDTTDGLTHTFYCGDCETRFSSRAELEVHQAQRNHKTERFVCELCAKTFTHRSALDMHFDVTHSSANGEVVHSCDVCGRCFNTLDALYQHQQCVGHSLPEICNVCAASYSTKEQLLEHYESTGHNDFFLCGDCPKKFVDKDALMKHQHSTGHTQGGRASELPAFAARRAALANIRRNFPARPPVRPSAPDAKPVLPPSATATRPSRGDVGGRMPYPRSMAMAPSLDDPHRPAPAPWSPQGKAYPRTAVDARGLPEGTPAELFARMAAVSEPQSRVGFPGMGGMVPGGYAYHGHPHPGMQPPQQQPQQQPTPQQLALLAQHGLVPSSMAP